MPNCVKRLLGWDFTAIGESAVSPISDGATSQQPHKTGDREVIFSKEATVLLCALISTDGGVRGPSKTHPGDLRAIDNTNLDYILAVKEFLIKNGIVAYVTTSRGKRKVGGKEYKNKLYRLYLNKWNPPRKRAKGRNQFLELAQSVKYWNLETILMKRKGEKLVELSNR